MTIDSVFVLFKRSYFDTILACLPNKVYGRVGGGGKFFVPEIERCHNFCDTDCL